ncbi:hypothetical protein JJD41_20105 [Oxynema sp. CENA135]|uniref:hypothetical protein n=1 Tax=Oxynema sp. CENA135 TaxID=984206 RepID=UPI00190D997B|nr:hypothetical protein [Oxynema sp. CENA135]MBK4732152.1 hypothetical protein [Oxynema sp. CENA135]
MQGLKNFVIEFHDPQTNYADPPKDPLNELSHFEWGLRKFCFEKNQVISIALGDRELSFSLDPDICMLLEDGFPEKIASLKQGDRVELDFPESWVTIALIPEGDRLTCTVYEYDRPRSQGERFEFDRDRTVQTLTDFLDRLLAIAVREGYISEREKQDFTIADDGQRSPTDT